METRKFLALAIGMIVVLSCMTVYSQTPKKQPSVYFIGCGGVRLSHEIAKQLQEAGFHLNHMHHPGLNAHPLTWDQVKKYNVLVIEGLGKSNADMSLSDKNKQTLKVLNRFLKEGGGILMLGAFGQQATVKPPQDKLLKPLGLTPLFEEMTVAPGASEIATSWNLPFSFTNNITESPISADVKGLWFPVPERRVGAQNHMISFKCDKPWQVVVKGGKKSMTRKGKLQEAFPKDPGTYNSEVPLAALRTVGSGRIVYLGITPEYILGPYALTTLEGVVMKKGLVGKPSDGFKLINNSLKWLAEPSLASGALGGAPMNKNMLKNPAVISYGKPFNWGTNPKFLPEESAFPGLIGARTQYSSGKGTVKEWADQAKKEKLAFVVFLEEFSELSAEEFEKLKKECKELSTPELALIPGFTIDDEVGNHYFYFGTAFGYPGKRFLTEDGKKFRSDDPPLAGKKPYIKGQLAMTVLNYAYTENSFKLTCGNYRFSQDNAPFANFFSNWDATGVITSENGKLIEDATTDYLQLVDFGQGPLPLAITLVDSPEQLKDVSWRTVLCFPEKGARLVGGFTAKGGTKIQQYFNMWHFYPDNPAKIYVSNGPEIVYWGYVGERDYGGNNKGNFVWQNYRWKIKGKVKSEVGLKEVAVYDGPELLRRFHPEGKKEFAFELDLSHDEQHNLVLIATDQQGRKAVGGEQWDRNHRMEEFNCADRNNQLSYGMIIRSDNTGIKLGGNQTLASPNKRLDGKHISPAGTFKNDNRLGAPAFDGATGGEPDVHVPVIMRLNGKEVHSPNVSESFRLFCTGDLNVGEGRWEHNFTDNIRAANVWHTLWSTEPAEKFTVTKRNHFFTPDPDSPLAVFLWDITIKLKQDCPDNSILVGFIQPRKSKLWAMHGSDGNVLAGNWEKTPQSVGRGIRLPFGPGAYGAMLNSPLGGGAVYSLTDGLEMSLYLPRTGRIHFSLPKEKSPVKKGEEKKVSLLLVGIPRLTRFTKNLPAASTEVVERFRNDMGLGGKPGYQLDTKTGSVTGSRYILDVDGKKDLCFSGKITGNLISSLPIRVAGLNDNWSAFLYDRKLKKSRPVGVFENRAWATVVIKGARDLFIGNPIVADNQELFLQVTQSGQNNWQVELHNPTDKPIETTIKANTFFDPLVKKGMKPEKVSIPAHSSVYRQL